MSLLGKKKMVNKSQIIRFKIQALKEWFVATSEVEGFKGIYLCDSSYEKVMEQIPAALQLACKIQFNEDVRVKKLIGENDSEKRSVEMVDFIAQAA